MGRGGAWLLGARNLCYGASWVQFMVKAEVRVRIGMTFTSHPTHHHKDNPHPPPIVPPYLEACQPLENPCGPRGTQDPRVPEGPRWAGTPPHRPRGLGCRRSQRKSGGPRTLARRTGARARGVGGGDDRDINDFRKTVFRKIDFFSPDP